MLPSLPPYFMPYVIDGYGEAYGSTVGLMKFENALTNPKAMLNGNFGGDAISSYMRLVTPYEGPRSILVKDFTDALNNINSTILSKLRENDAVYGWDSGVRRTGRNEGLTLQKQRRDHCQVSARQLSSRTHLQPDTNR